MHTVERTDMTASEKLAASREKNADRAVYLLASATANGDELRATLARAILKECGRPGGKGAPSVNDAMTAIIARDEAAATKRSGGC
jgi:hypothetical protein